MRKVLFIASGDDKYGAPKSMMDMILPLKSFFSIIPIVLSSREGKLNDFCKENNIEEVVVGNSEFMVVGGSNLFRKIVKRIMLPYLIIKYHKRRKDAIANVESGLDLSDIDIIHTNVNRVDTGAILARKYGIPHVWHLREFGQEDYNCMSLIPQYISFMNANADAFIAISEAVKTAWVSKGLDETKIAVINDGISGEEFVEKTRYRKSTEEKMKIVFCGLISETKGQKTLIDAVKLLDENYRSNIQIDFYGGGRKAYIRKLRKDVSRNNLDGVISFRGYSSNLKELLANYDVGVVASKAEALGRVTVEYMYAGLYVVASDTGANPDILKHGEYGSLFTMGNSEELAKKIVWAFKNPGICKDKAALSQKMVMMRFGMERCAEEIEKLYAAVVKREG